MSFTLVYEIQIKKKNSQQYLTVQVNNTILGVIYLNTIHWKPSHYSICKRTTFHCKITSNLIEKSIIDYTQKYF